MSERSRTPIDRVFDLVVPRAIDAVDPDELIARVDVDQLIERLDVDALMARVDIDALLERVDIDALIRRVDINGIVGRVDIDALIKRVDINGIVGRVDIDALIGEVDVNAMVDRVDIAGLVAKAGIDQIVSDAATGVAGRTLDAFRRQLHRLDRTLMRVIDRLLRRRGEPLTGANGEPLAGPLARTLGFIVDSAVVAITFSLTLLLITTLVGLFTRSQFEVKDDGGWVWGLVFLGWWFLYLATSFAVAGRTIGKGLMGLLVQDLEGNRPAVRRCLVRTFVFPFSFILGLGFVPALLGKQRRALHEYASHTTEVVWWPDRVRQPIVEVARV